MVNKHARELYRQVLLDFIKGKSTNYGYEDAIPVKTGDCCISEIEDVVWRMYNDFPEQNFDFQKLSYFQKKLIARALLFLKTEEEYIWEEFSSGSRRKTLTDRLFSKKSTKKLHPVFKERFWPFKDRNSYSRAYKRK